MKDKPKNIVNDDSCNGPLGIALLKISYFIAIIDLVQALFFLVQSISALIFEVDFYSIAAFLGSIFWIIMVILLLVGLAKRYLLLITCWLIFAVLGIIVDIIVFLWAISVSEYVEWPQVIQFTILYLGIVFEWFCIYIVYNYCLSMAKVQFDFDNGQKTYHHKDQHHSRKESSSNHLFESENENEETTVIYLGAPK